MRVVKSPLTFPQNQRNMVPGYTIKFALVTLRLVAEILDAVDVFERAEGAAESAVDDSNNRLAQNLVAELHPTVLFRILSSPREEVPMLRIDVM